MVLLLADSALSFCASMVNSTTSTTGSQCLVPGPKYWPIIHAHAEELHCTQKSLQSGSHMFLHVPDELRLVPSLRLDEVLVWSLDMLPFLKDLCLLTLARAKFSAVCFSFILVPHLRCKHNLRAIFTLCHWNLKCDILKALNALLALFASIECLSVTVEMLIILMQLTV